MRGMTGPHSSSWLRPFLRTLAPTFREVLVLSACINVLALAVPVFVLQVYDRVVFHAGLSTLQGLVVGMVVVIVFDFVFRQTRARIMQTVALRADVVVGRRLFDKLMALPLRTLETQPTSYWQTLFRDVDVVRNTVSGATAVLIVDLPFVLLFLALTFVIARPVAWVLLGILPVFLLVAWRSGAAVASASRTEKDAGLARDRLVAEIIAGRTTVKALGLEAAMRPAWEQKHADTIERALVRGARADGYAGLGATLTMASTVLLTAIGAVAIVNQQLTIGALIAANILGGRMIGPLAQLVGSWRAFVGFRESAARLGAAFDLADERRDTTITLDRPKGNFSVDAVSFAFSSTVRPVVDSLHLALTAPGVYGIIGRNGCGKTTLLKLMQGLYTPASGRILLDGADVAQFTRAQLAAWIGYVPQECALFSGTIRDNIAQRQPDASDDAITAAAEAAGVHAVIVDLPDGYGTEVGEAGHRLSAGQCQRIAIARAMVGNPPVLLLDEPSSSLDRQAEQALAARVQQLGRERTVVMVTHSPALLQACGTVIGMHNGRVAVSGPAAQVLPRLLGTSRPAAEGTAAPVGAAAAEASE